MFCWKEGDSPLHCAFDFDNDGDIPDSSDVIIIDSMNAHRESASVLRTMHALSPVIPKS